MTDHELGFEGGTVVGPHGRRHANVYLRHGKVSAVTAAVEPAGEVVDASGLLVLPGMVDTHVHFMEPGATDREDFPTGTAAAAASGVTTVIEHTHARPVREPAELDAKLAALEGRANVDYALAAHVWPDRLAHLAALWQRGVAFFKAFTCTTHGIPGLDAAALRAAFEAIAAFDGVALVHCEDESLTADAERALRADGRDDPAVIVEWRNRDAEMAAVTTVALLAGRTGVRAGIAHVSSPEVAEVVRRARADGARLAAEACPQYFLLREPEILDQGPFRKFTPPARGRTDSDEAHMWEHLRRGVLTHVATDHAPATREQKLAGDIWDVHFGLPGIDTTLRLLLDAASRGTLAVEDVVARYSDAPARWYGLFPHKGGLHPGADGDVVLASLGGAAATLSDADVWSKAGWTPFAGREVLGRVHGVWLRGRQVSHQRRPHDERHGRFVPGPGARGGP